MSTDPDRLAWRRSTGCSSGSCVEAAVDADTVYLRDSKLADSPVLRFSHQAWRAFLRDLP